MNTKGGQHRNVSGAVGPSRSIRRGVAMVLVPLLLATVTGLVLLWPEGNTPEVESGELFDATIMEIQPCDEQTFGEQYADEPPAECQQARVQVHEGPDTGAEVFVMVPFGAGAPDFGAGDEVVLAGQMDTPADSVYELFDFQRDAPLGLLAVIFAAAVIAIARWRGLAALTGLAVTVVVLYVFALPSLLEGQNPLAVAVVGAAVIMVATLYLCHGLSIRTSVALVGTLLSLTITGLLGALFIELASFSGVGTEDATFLAAYGVEVDLRGLLLAGLVIGALGVLDDVTITQTAAVWELAAAAPESSRLQLWLAGMRIGRDHVAATVNTLVLAYAGASLPLLMLFTVLGRSPLEVATSEIVATEVIRALVGGLGIIAAVPITTGLAAMVVRSSETRVEKSRPGVLIENDSHSD